MCSGKAHSRGLAGEMETPDALQAQKDLILERRKAMMPGRLAADRAWRTCWRLGLSAAASKVPAKERPNTWVPGFWDG
jgi:hypothetical protein